MTKSSRALAWLALLAVCTSAIGQAPKTDTGGSLAGLPKLESEGVFVYWSEAKDTAWGLSKSLRKYTKIPLPPGAKEAGEPKLSGDIAVWQIGSAFYAFSGKIPQWDILILSADAKPQLTVGDGQADVTSGDQRFVFTAAAGRWKVWEKNNAADSKLPYSASLLLVKANWSQAPAAVEIGADLRRVLEGEAVPEKDLAELPASGSRVLFPASAGPTYTAQHYAELLSWLISRQLVMQLEPFGIAAKPIDSPTADTVAIPTLSKTYESFGLRSSKSPNDLFFQQTTEFHWSVWEETVQRELDQYERARGQSESKPIAANTYDRLEVAYGPLDEGHVLIMHAFPGDSGSDVNVRRAVNAKGFEALLVIQRKAAAPVAVVEPKLLLPDKVQRIKAERSRGNFYGGPAASTAPAEPLPGSVSRSIISKNVMVNWSENFDTVWGFSIPLGKWSEQKLDPPAKERPTPLVNDDLFIWRVGSIYYAFSGEKCQWDVLRLPEGHTPPPVIDSGFFRVHDGDTLYTFAASSGRWSSPASATSAPAGAAERRDLENKRITVEKLFNAATARLTDFRSRLADSSRSTTPAERQLLETNAASTEAEAKSLSEQLEQIISRLSAAPAQGSAGWNPPAAGGAGGATTSAGGGQENRQTNVIRLRFARAPDVQRIVEQTFARENATIAIDDRLNGVVVSAPPDVTQRIFRLVETLDQRPTGENPDAAASSATTATSGTPKTEIRGGEQASTIAAADAPDMQIKVISLRNALALDAEHVIRQLFGRELLSLSADPRTNSLIVRGSPELTTIVYHILVRLDEGEVPALPAAGRKTESRLAAPAAPPEKLAGQFDAKEQEAARLAKQIRDLQAAPQPAESRIKELSAQLSRVVAESFAARQQLHQAEVAQLQQRIAGIEQTLKLRDRLSKEIIDHRFKDLLNPDLQWESTSQSRSRLPGGTYGETQSSSRLPVGTSRDSTASPSVTNKSGTSTTTTSPTNPVTKTALTDSGLVSPKSVSVGNHANSVIQHVLGVDVEFVTGPTVSNAGFRGGFLVIKKHFEEFEPNLRPGDIIVGLNGWETLSDAALAWAALQPADKKIIFQMPKTRQVEETVPAHIVREGKYQIVNVELQAGWDPAPRTFGSQPTSSSGRGNTPVPPLRPSSTGRSSPLPTAPSSANPAGSPIVLGGGDNTITLRSPDEFRRQLSSLQASIESTKAKDLKTFAGLSEAEKEKTKQSILDNNQRNLDFLREEYTAQLRLLELERTDAASAAESAADFERVTRKLYENGQTPVTAVNEAQRMAKTAQLRLDRAQTLLDLYRKADPKQTDTAPAVPGTEGAPAPEAAPATKR